MVPDRPSELAKSELTALPENRVWPTGARVVYTGASGTWEGHGFDDLRLGAHLYRPSKARRDSIRSSRGTSGTSKASGGLLERPSKRQRHTLVRVGVEPGENRPYRSRHRPGRSGGRTAT